MEETELFYNPLGLKAIAELIQAQTTTGSLTQKKLAALAGVGASTVGKFMLNLHNPDDKVLAWVKPSFLIRLAPYLDNPETGEKFTPAELLTWASHFDLIPKLPDNKPAKRVNKAKQSNALPYPKSVAEIKKRLGKRKLEDLATASEVPLERLQEILTSPDPAIALPSWAEVLKIAGELYPDKICDPLISLYSSEAQPNGRTAANPRSGSQPPRSLLPCDVQTFPGIH